MENYDIVIIGGGPAGLAAAVAAKRNGGDSILILERDKVYSQWIRASHLQGGTDRTGVRPEIYRPGERT